MRNLVYVDVIKVASPLLATNLPPSVELRVYTAEELEELTGYPPREGELDGLNCPDAGLIGHLMCGCCVIHQKPRSVCGCPAPIGRSTDSCPALRVATDEEDPRRIGVDLERIEGWPGLNAFPGAQRRMGEMLMCEVSDAARAAVETIVLHLLCELAQRGALVRSWKDDRRWIYDGRNR